MARRAGFLMTAAMMTALAGHADQLPDFSQFDLDDDGLISEDEYVSHQTGTRRANESEALAKFARFDLDQNHTVSEDELRRAVDAWRGTDDDTSVSATDPADSQ
jgi:Ca2+-binding EF-hand superfamily protein